MRGAATVSESEVSIEGVKDGRESKMAVRLRWRCKKSNVRCSGRRGVTSMSMRVSGRVRRCLVCGSFDCSVTERMEWIGRRQKRQAREVGRKVVYVTVAAAWVVAGGQM